jgi:hypothetical protein
MHRLNLWLWLDRSSFRCSSCEGYGNWRDPGRIEAELDAGCEDLDGLSDELIDEEVGGSAPRLGEETRSATWGVSRDQGTFLDGNSPAPFFTFVQTLKYDLIISTFTGA